MASTTADKTVGEYVAEQPALMRAFERLGIDYCCGGNRPLAEVCREKGLDFQTVVRVLAACENGRAADDHGNWGLTTMGQLLDHITAEHHGLLRAELPRLTGLLGKVVAERGDREPQLREVQQIFATFRAEAEQHMTQEEQILFPMIRQLEMAKARPTFHCGSVGNPIQAMEAEHAGATGALHRIRALSRDYVAPEEAGNAYRALLDGLRELEVDMHRHMHEENNILFPKAIKAEAALS